MKKMIVLLAVPALLAACNNGPAKTETGDGKSARMQNAGNRQEQNKKTIMACMEAFGKGDLATMFKDAAADYVDYSDGTMPPVKSVDSTRAFVQQLLQCIEGYKPSGEMYAADGDYVYYYATWSGLFKKDFMGIRATGKMISCPDCDIFKFNEAGKITEHRSVQNMAAVLMGCGTPGK